MGAAATHAIARRARSLRARVAGWSDRQLVAAFVLATVLLRLPFVAAPLGIDEGGYAYVARRWAEAGGQLYGDQWVDRPPALIGLYALANSFGGGTVALRLLGMVAACIVVAACAGAAGRVAGRDALGWSGLVATVLCSSAMLQGQTVNAELPAIACTALAAWLVVVAMTTSHGRAVVVAAGAGVAAASAVLFKQSFVDAFAFALGAIAVVAIIGGARGRVRAARVAAAGVAGAAVPLALVLTWAATRGPGIGAMLDALYRFRLQAGQVLGPADGAEADRALVLATVVVVSGVLALLLATGIGLVRIVSGHQVIRCGVDVTTTRAVAGGVLGMGAIGLVGVVGGGSWWTHYLLQLVPALAIGVGIVVAAGPGRRRSQVARAAAGWACIAVVVAACAWMTAVAMNARGDLQRRPVLVGDWVASAASPHDTAFVMWGRSNVLERSGLHSPYPMSWSLPMRVRDPELAELRTLLRSAHAPTWIVQWNAINSWGIDEDGALRAVVRDRYELASVVCGVRVLRLRSDAAASSSWLPPVPAASACGTSSSDAVAGTIGSIA